MTKSSPTWRECKLNRRLNGTGTRAAWAQAGLVPMRRPPLQKEATNCAKHRGFAILEDLPWKPYFLRVAGFTPLPFSRSRQSIECTVAPILGSELPLSRIANIGTALVHIGWRRRP